MNFILILIFIKMPLLFHFWYSISKRRTHDHDPDYHVVIQNTAWYSVHIKYPSRPLSLFSCMCVSLSFFLEEKNNRGTKTRFMPMTHRFNVWKRQFQLETKHETYSGGCKKSWLLLLFSFVDSWLIIVFESFNSPVELS